MFSWDAPKKWVVSERAFQAEEMGMITPICLKAGSRSTGRSQTPYMSLQHSVYYWVFKRRPVNICGWISSFIQTPEVFTILIKKADGDVIEETGQGRCSLPNKDPDLSRLCSTPAGCCAQTPRVEMWLEICRTALQTWPPQWGRSGACA